MSRNRKLQFYSLSGVKEAQALEHLVSEGSDSVTFSDRSDLLNYMYNAIIATQGAKQKLAIVLDSDCHQWVQDWLDDQGFGAYLFNYTDRTDRSFISTLLEDQESNSLPQTRSLWQQAYNIGDLWAYRYEVLRRKSLGDNPLSHVFYNYIQTSTTHTDRLDEELKTEDYSFNTQEYWFLRGRVNGGAQIWLPELSNCPGLQPLHPVFFDMYKPEEAYIVIYEMARKYRRKNSEVLRSLEQWKKNYHQWLRNHHAEWVSRLRWTMQELRLGMVEFLERSNEKPKAGWFNWSQDNRTEQQNTLIQAYLKLRNEMISREVQEVIHLPECHEVKLALGHINEGLNQFQSLHRHLKIERDRHLRRLNRHTIKNQELRQSFESILAVHQEMTSEINGFQIFKEHLDDHSLELHLLEQYLTDMGERWDHLQRDIPYLKRFIAWQQFMASLTAKDKNLIKALEHIPTKHWLITFDAWYYKHYLECQDLVNVGSNHFREKWLPLLAQLQKSMKLEVETRLHNQITHSLKSFTKVNKKFGQWLQKGQEYGDLPMDQKLWLDRLGVLIFKQEDEKEVRSWQPDAVIQISQNSASRTHNVLSYQVLSIDENPQEDSIFYPPNVDHGILFSDHHQRMSQIKACAQYIIRAFPKAYIWQNKHSVIVSDLDTEKNKLLSPIIESELGLHGYIEALSTDDIVETLLNNRNRTFTFLHDKGYLKSNSTYAPFFVSTERQFFEKMGMEVVEISWETMGEYAELMRHLSDKDSPKVLTHVHSS